MTDNEMRIAIAEACGKCVPDWQYNGCGCRCRKCGKVDHSGFGIERMHDPESDYLNDLNAMHEAEKMLDEDQRDYFIDKLSTTIYGDVWPQDWVNEHWSKLVMATARQRSEAFLRCLGKWRG